MYKTMIPPLIHHMWLDKNEYENQGPLFRKELYDDYVKSWKEHHPDYSFWFWNRREVEELWERQELSRWKSLYYRVHRHIEKCDISRYALLYVHGGLYVDLDFKCNSSLGELFNGKKAVIFREVKDYYHRNELCYLNSIMASEPGNSIWAEILDYISLHYHPHRLVIDNTGPRMLGSFIGQRGLQKSHPEWFLDPCLVDPLCVKITGVELSSHCKQTYLNKEDAVNRAYAYTKWKEGSYWGTGSLTNQMISVYGTFIALVLFFLIAAVVIIVSGSYWKKRSIGQG